VTNQTAHFISALEVVRVKSAYQKPVLRHFGLVRELTAGGSGIDSENNPQDYCGNESKNKQRC